MRCFKLFLTLGVCGLLGMASPGLAEETKTPERPPVLMPLAPPPEPPVLSKEVIHSYMTSTEPTPAEKATGTAKNQFIGYAWPFTDRDLNKELGTTPVVLELFTTQGCIFCPVADKFFSDLVERAPNIIGLACHVDYLDVSKGSLSMKACTARQSDYATTIGSGNIYTPQMVMNGQRQAFGFEYEAVYKNLKDSAAAPLAALSVEKLENGTYEIAVADLQLPADAKPELQVLTYRHPVSLSISEGANHGAEMNYQRSVSAIKTNTLTGKAEKISEDVAHGPDDTGAVIMIRNNGIILAVAEIKF